METFAFVASMPPGSEIVFDCAVPESSLSDNQKLARQARANRVAAVGESWLTHFDPVSLASDLRQMGFTQIEDLGPDAANERYFKDRTDGLRLAGAAHLMKASL